MTQKEIILAYVVSTGIMNLFLGYVWDGKKSFNNTLVKIILLILTVFAGYMLFKVL